MKRLFTILFSLMLTVTLLAQNDVTTFLGIPVDGSKAEFIQKLMDKGFVMDYKLDMLTGKFNGRDSYINISENNGKVWRVSVIDKTSKDETQIKIDFNYLTALFRQDGKYIGHDDNRMLDESDHISYDVRIRHKQYQNVFYQKDISDKAIDTNKTVWLLLNEISYGQYLLVIMYDNKYNEDNGENLQI